MSLFEHLDFYRRLLERRLQNAFAELRGPGERYRLLYKLGRGGMGEVWLGVDRKLGRRVAVKLMRADTTMDPSAAARFEREISATIQLGHPHTVRVYDHGVTVDGVRYYVMELLDGRNLAELIQDEGPLRPTRAVELVRQAASALAEAHDAGIIHRDVKPQNFAVVSESGRRDFLKVLDFGLAIGIEDVSLTAEGICAGSPSYVSPEVITGHAADRRSDIYGLGGVLYTLLTGRPPFVAGSARDVLLAHLHVEPTAPSAVSPHDIPPELDDLVLRCLAKNPKLRPASAAELFDELVYFLRVHASRIFRGDSRARPIPRRVPIFHPPEPIVTRIALSVPALDDGEDMPTIRRGPPGGEKAAARRSRAELDCRPHRRLYEANLDVTKDVCIDDSVIEINPDDLDTYPEGRSGLVRVA